MGRIRADGTRRMILLATAGLVAAMLPLVVAPTPAAAADAVLPPILLVGADGEDNGTGAGNPAARVDTWSYQIKNPNAFDLTATIEVNSATFAEGATGVPSGTWLQTQVIAVLVPANSATPVEKRLATPPAIRPVAAGASYAFRAVWDDYPSVDSNYGGIRWPALIVVPSSLGAAFTDPGPPFVGGGGVIHGFIDNRGPDFVSALACEFDGAGTPTGNHTHEWWVQNSAFTGNPELLNVELTQPNDAAVSGVPGLPRQLVDWATVRSAAEPVNGAAVVTQTWQHARAWFRPIINSQNPGGTAADNTYPWTGTNPPGSVWARSGSAYSKHNTTLVQADDCAVKYSNLPVHSPGPPAVAITFPTAGATVSGAITIAIDATDNDPAGTLGVDASTDAGTTWSPALWNAATSRYELVWDTTTQPDGPATLDARATDSDTNTTNATQIAITIQNTSISPTVSITNPTPGSTVNGAVTIAVDATDDDAAGTLGVEASTNGGTTWNAAIWNTGTSRYEYSWNTASQPDGPATVDARATDSDTNTTNATQIAVTIDNTPDPELVVAAGDIAGCELTSDDAVGDLLDTIFAAETGIIATAGDNAYPDGTAADFVCFDDAWGQHKAIIHPSAGNHDYNTPGATGYYGYFGAAAGDPTKGYYSYDIGESWHAIVLNSNCGAITGGCAAGGAQEQWLRGVLVANASKNVLAYWHHPRFSKNQYNDNAIVQPLWQALYEYGAEMVLTGHEHHYERYVPLDGAGASDPTNGIRQFIVGTGGTTLRSEVQSASPLSAERHFGDHGVIKLYLLADSYSWEFVSVSGTYTDSGSSPIHGAPGVDPSAAIAAPTNGSTVSGTITIAVAATDDDPSGTLSAEVSTNGGATWTPAPWNNGTGRYEFTWDTTAAANGQATIDARVTDSNSHVANATQVTVTVTNSPTASYRDTVVADGANVYWRLAETAGTVAVDDLVGNNANYLGGPGLGATGLIPGGNPAVAFDGIDDAVHLVNSSEINQGGPYLTKSIEMWFELSGTSARQMLYEQGSIAIGLSLYVLNGQLYAGAYNTSNSGGDTPWGPVFLSTPVSAGTPHHVVVVFDQPTNTFRLYLDGALAGSANGIGQLYNHGRSAFGAQWDWARYHDGARFGDLYNVAGTIDEVALYPVALSGSAILSHYTIGTNAGPISPSATITGPAAGAIVAGSTTVRVNATDDDPAGTLNVEVSTDSGNSWNPALWNAGLSRYEYVWDTTPEADGPATIAARATDSDVNTTAATPVAVTINNTVGPPYRDVVLGDGAAVYWRLGEASGSAMLDELAGNHNTYLGSPTLGAPSLIDDADSAVGFDGVNDTVRLVNSTDINQANPALTKTIELWFKASNVSGRQVLIEQGSITRGLNIYLLNGRLYAGIYNTSDSGGDTPWGPVFISTPVANGTGYHVAMVFDQPTNTFSLYVNGSLADSAGGVGQLYAHGRSAIGSQWDWARYHDGARLGDQSYFAGTLDEIAIYPAALSPATIATHYLAGS